MNPRTSISTWRCFLVSFFVTASLLTIQGFEPYFQRPIDEQSDFAANSLRIADAMQFREIYGNYSRWGFSHPGPAFFYVYAWGQAVFHYGLGICPEEHNAQLFTGMLLQTAFWSLALCVIYTHAQRWQFVLLCASLGFVHFQFSEQAFISIWPPNQLLMPFLCMLLSTASILAGERKWLWLFTLSACFTVHGHVAQPLFVIPATLAVLVGLVYGSHKGPDRLRNRLRLTLLKKDVGIATAITVPFLIPIFIDWTLLRDSNLASILSHLRNHHEPDRSVKESLHYLIQFYRYWGFHDLPPAGDSTTTLQTYPFIFSSWILASVASLLGLAYAWKHNTTSNASLRWSTSLLLTCIVSLILTIKWGNMMDGKMFAFNAFINYAIIFLQGCFIASVLACFWSRRVELACVAVSAFLLVFAVVHPQNNDRWISDEGDRPMKGRNLQLANGNLTLPQNAWIYIQSRNISDDWMLILGQANAWRKAGLNVAVPDDLKIPFGTDHAIQNVINRHQPTKLTCIEVKPSEADDNLRLNHQAIFEQVAPLRLDSEKNSISLESLAQMHSGTFVEAEDSANDYTQMHSHASVIVLPCQPPPQHQSPPQQLGLEIELAPPLEDTFWLTLSIGQTELLHQKIENRTRLHVSLPPFTVRRCITDYGAILVQLNLSTQAEPLGLFSKRATIGFRIHEFSLVRETPEINLPKIDTGGNSETQLTTRTH